MPTSSLKKSLFEPVLKRVRRHIDSLQGYQRFPHSGIEGWLKVETVAALGPKVTKVSNKGVDLVVKNIGGVELKAATDFNLSLLRDGVLKNNAPCLFLVGGKDAKNIKNIFQLDREQIEVVACKRICDGSGYWFIGLIKPKANLSKARE